MDASKYQLVEANSADHFSAAAKLFSEYAASLNFDLQFQDFDKELDELSIQYSAPGGGLILIHHEEEFVGCVGIRQFAPEIAELKRMYIQPSHRGGGLGNLLMENAIRIARDRGYTRIRLDTIRTMTNAIRVYYKFGFHEIDAYRFNPMEGVLYLEKDILLP